MRVMKIRIISLATLGLLLFGLVLPFLHSPQAVSAATNYTKPSTPFDQSNLYYEKVAGSAIPNRVKTNLPDFEFLLDTPSQDKADVVSGDPYHPQRASYCEKTAGLLLKTISCFYNNNFNPFNQGYDVVGKYLSPKYLVYLSNKEVAGTVRQSKVRWMLLVEKNGSPKNGELRYLISDNAYAGENYLGATIPVDWVDATMDGGALFQAPYIVYHDSYKNKTPVTINNESAAPKPLKSTPVTIKGGLFIKSGEVSKVIDTTLFKVQLLEGATGTEQDIKMTNNVISVAGGSLARFADTTVNMTLGLTYKLTYDSGSSSITSENYGAGTLGFKIDASGNVTITDDNADAKKSPINGNSITSGADFYIPTTITRKSMLADALNGALVWVADLISGPINFLATGIEDELQEGNNILANDGLKNVWTGVRNITLGLLTLALLIIAFANVLSIDPEKYGLNRILPKIIIAIVLSAFSFLITGAVLEISSALTNMLIDKSAGSHFADTLKVSQINGFVDTTMNAAKSTGLGLLLILVLLAELIALIALWFLLLVRIVVIWFLVALFPAAILMNILPFTEFLYKEWNKRFWIWAFMGPLVAALIWFDKELLTKGFTFDLSGAENNNNAWVFLAMSAACVFLTVALPYSLGSEIYGNIKKAREFGRNNWLSRKTGLTGFLDSRKATVAAKEKLRGQNLQARLANINEGKGFMGGIGRFAAGVGTDKGRAAELDNLLVDQLRKQKVDEGINRDTARGQYAKASAGSRERRALARLMSEEGWHDGENIDNLQRIIDDSAIDPVVWKNFTSKSPEILANMERELAAGNLTIPANAPGYLNIAGENAKARGKAYGTVTDLKAEQATQVVSNMATDPALKGEFNRFVTNVEKLKKLAESGNERTAAVIGDALRNLTATQRAEIDAGMRTLSTDQRRDVANLQRRLQTLGAQYEAERAAGINKPTVVTVNKTDRTEGLA